MTGQQATTSTPHLAQTKYTDPPGQLGHYTPATAAESNRQQTTTNQHPRPALIVRIHRQAINRRRRIHKGNRRFRPSSRWRRRNRIRRFGRTGKQTNLRFSQRRCRQRRKIARRRIRRRRHTITSTSRSRTTRLRNQTQRKRRHRQRHTIWRRGGDRLAANTLRPVLQPKRHRVAIAASRQRI